MKVVRVPGSRKGTRVGAAISAVTAWTALGVMSLFVLINVFDPTATIWFALAQGLTPYLLAPAWPLAVVASLMRRRWLGVVSVAIAAIHLIYIGPSIWGECRSVEAPAGSRIRIASVNVAFSNRDLAPIYREIRSFGADVVAIQELNTRQLENMRRVGADRQFSASVQEVREDASGGFLGTTLPLLGTERDDLLGYPLLRLTARVGGQPVEFWNVHAKAPLNSPALRLRNQQLSVLAARSARLNLPLVIAGDFNANRWHPAFKELLDSGMRDSHDALGRGLAATWTNSGDYPRVLLLDHVLVNRHLTPVSVREGMGEGSDHRPVFAELSISSSGC